LIRNLRRDVKILGQGDLGVKLAVSAHAFSKSAVEKIEAAGGSVTWLKPPHEKKVRRHKKATPAASEAPAEAAEAEEPASEAAEEPAAEEPTEGE
jgi:large subunit ribosomal protein L15